MFEKKSFLGGHLDLKLCSTETPTTTMFTHEEVVFPSSEDKNIEEIEEEEVEESEEKQV